MPYGSTGIGKGAKSNYTGHDDLNRVLAETNQLGKSRGYEYDAVGNLTKLTDRNGRITEYVYDDRYRLDQEICKTGAGGTVRTLDFTHNEASQSNHITRYEDLDAPALVATSVRNRV